MVVVTVRHADTAYPTARRLPLLAKLPLMAGFALGCWLALVLLGDGRASAAEPATVVTASPGTGSPTAHSAPSTADAGTALLGFLGTTLTTTLGTVTDTVGQVTGTVTTLTSTVPSTVTTTMTGTVNTVAAAVGGIGGIGGVVTAPITTILAPPAATAPATKTPARAERDAAPATEPASRGWTAPAAAPQAAAPATDKKAVSPQQRGRSAQPRRVAARPTPEFAQSVSSGSRAPAPAPSLPGNQFCGLSATADNGNCGKHPLAVLGAQPSAPRPRVSGMAAPPAVAGGGRDAALPTTSPD